MNSSYFIEEKWCDNTELSILFSNEDLQNLITKGILLSEGNSLFKFVFVGVVSLRNLVFIILPKVLKKEKVSSINIKSTVQTLKKYSNQNNQKFDGIDYLVSYQLSYINLYSY